MCAAPVDHHEARAGDRSATMRSSSAGGVDGSSAPATTSVGASIVAEPAADVPARRAPRSSARSPRGRSSRNISRYALDAVERGREPAAEHGVDDRLRAPRARTSAARSSHCRGLAEARRRCTRGRAARPLGRVEREPHPDRAAEREPDERERARRHRVEDARREVVDVADLARAARRRGPGARRDDPPPGERGQLRVPDRATSSRASRRGRPSAHRAVERERAVDERVGRAEVVLGPRRRRCRSAPPRRACPRAMFARIRSVSTSSPSSDGAPPPPRRRSRRARRRAPPTPRARRRPRARAPARTLSRRSAAFARRVARAGAASTARDRVALVRHRRRAARLALRHLGDLGLREQHDVAGDLRRRSCDAGERAARARRSASASCATARPARAARARPRRARSTSGPSLAERGERARGAAELRRQRAGDRGETRSRLDERRRASRPPCSRTSSAPPAAAACARPSPCRRARPRVARSRPRRLRRLRVDDAHAPAARRASPPCRGCPGSSRRGARTRRAHRRPARAARARAARPGCRRRGPRAASCRAS